MDLALRLARVFVFDDGLNSFTLSDNASVAGGVCQIDGEQRQLLATAQRHQGLQGIGPGQGHIARQHQHHTVIPQGGDSLLHRMPCPELGLLTHALHRQGLGRGQHHRLDLLSPMTSDHHGRAGVQLGGRVEHMLHQWHTRETVQDLGQPALHARAFASGHDDNVDGEKRGVHERQTF